MKVLIVSPKNKTVFNFRGDLIRDILAAGHEVLVTGPNRDFVEDILSLGVREFIEIPLIKDNTSIKGDLQYLRALKRIIKEQKPDLVFSYTIKPVIYGSLAAKAAGVPHIFAMVTGLGRVYASDSLKAKAVRRLTKLLYKRAFAACEKVIFQNSDDLRQFVDDRYLPAAKAEKVDGSGVNMERFLKTDLPDAPVFLMVGRIIREKGVMEYCAAAREIRRQHPEARCILLGGFDSSLGALQKDDIAPYIADGSIEFPGEVKDPVSFYRACSVFVLPSYYREGVPRTILEAMSCGRAVITTDWPGCREAVVDSDTGFLVEPRSAEALARRMADLAGDPELRRAMGERSYARCKQVYAVDIVNQSMKKILGY